MNMFRRIREAVREVKKWNGARMAIIPFDESKPINYIFSNQSILITDSVVVKYHVFSWYLKKKPQLSISRHGYFPHLQIWRSLKKGC